MRNFGHALMWLGFLTAAFLTTRELDRIDWPLYSVAAVVGVAGVVLLRRTAFQAAAQTETVRTNIVALESALKRLVRNLEAMNANRDSILVYDVHGKIDAELLEDLAEFADARESMIHGIGLQGYANVMDHFARSERAINRAWSASADGYVDEVWTYLEMAEKSMREADFILASHVGGRAGGPDPSPSGGD
jgi:hypothetical protein